MQTNGHANKLSNGQNTVAIVPFRSGSKGLFQKNFRMLGGVPLWLRAALQGTNTCEKLVCSTDRLDLCNFDKLDDVLIDHRPASLADDDSTMTDVISHLIYKFSLQDDILVLLQPTTPLRTHEQIEQAIHLYLNNDYSMIMSVVEHDNRCLKFGLNNSGVFSHINEAQFCFNNRQSLPKVYGPNGAIYVFRGKDFLKSNQFPSKKIGILEMSSKTSVDVDTKDDFRKAERLIKKGLMK